MKESYRSWTFSKDAENFIENKLSLETTCLENNLDLTEIINKYDNISPEDGTLTEFER